MSLNMIKILYFTMRENTMKKVPLVLLECDVTGAMHVLLLIAAIQLKVILPAIWD